MIILLDAGPGSGKTTTLEAAFHFMLTNRYPFIPTEEQAAIFQHIAGHFGLPNSNWTPPYGPTNISECVFIAFNTSTVDRLKSHLPAGTACHTFGGMGLSLLTKRHGYQALDNQRGQKLLSHLLGKNLVDLEYKQRLELFSLLKYVSCMKEELLFPENEEAFRKIEQKYGMPPANHNVELAQRLMQLMSNVDGSVEFIDQVWLGLQTLNHMPKPPFKLAFVDEIQDLSALRLEFVLNLAEHLVGAGDPNQAINAFAGADHNAFRKIEQIADTKLPLKVSFRLPPNHIDYANTLCNARIAAHKKEAGPIEVLRLEEKPLSETFSGQSDGFMTRIKEFLEGHYYNRVSDIFEPRIPVKNSPKPFRHTPENQPDFFAPLPTSTTDPKCHLVIGRTNAEIFRVAIRMLMSGIPCKIVRRKGEQDILTTLIYYVGDKEKYLKKAHKTLTVANILPLLQRDITKANEAPYKQGAVLYEKASSILHIANTLPPENPTSHIESCLYQICNEHEEAVRLCTIHKAKGMESPFIYILFPPIHHPLAESPEDKKQEANLEFVSETRSQFYKAYVKE